MPFKFLTSAILSAVISAQTCPDDFISEMESGAASSLASAQNAVDSVSSAMDSVVAMSNDAVAAGDLAN